MDRRKIEFLIIFFFYEDVLNFSRRSIELLLRYASVHILKWLGHDNAFHCVPGRLNFSSSFRETMGKQESVVSLRNSIVNKGSWRECAMFWLS